MLHKIRNACSIFLCAMIFGCASADKIDDDDQNAAILYQDARAALNTRDYVKAATLYSELESRFPFSTYAQQAMYDSAYAYYKGGDPDSAIAAADRFIRLYPRHPRIDYAYYIKGLTNFHKNDGLFDKLLNTDKATRDPKPYVLSMHDFNTLLTQFPESIYAEDARKRVLKLRDVLARNELEIAKFYVKRDAYVAAINRAQFILEAYGDSSAAAGAKQIIAEAKTNMGLE